MLSPTASNAPGWKDTHPAARNVPVVGRGASVTGPWGQLLPRKEWQRDGRVRRRGTPDSCPHEALQDNDKVRP